MKRLFVVLLGTLTLCACKKHICDSDKIKVCHYDAKSGGWHTIEISVNALPAHLQQGDVLGDCSTAITKICDQTWMVKNLNVDHYRNGDPIPEVTDATEWATLTTGAWCYYSNMSSNDTVYGKLYNWYAVNDARGLAPSGWHVPSDAEWATLSDCIGHGDPSVVGTALKSATGWIDGGNGTNSSGFTGLPGGSRFSDDVTSNFSGQGDQGVWWTTTLSTTSAPISQALSEFDSYLHESYYLGISNLSIGYSVRCVKD